MRRGWISTAVLAGLVVACQALSLPVSRPTETPLAPTPVPATATPAGTASPAAPALALLPTPGATGDDAAAHAVALLAAFESDIGLDPNWTRYQIEAAVEFTPGELKATIRGQVRLRYVVPPGRSVDELPLMLWPNNPQYHASMRAGPALVNGVRLDGVPDLDGVALWLSLTSPARAGDVLDVSLPFEIEAGGPIGGTRPRRFGITQNVFIAPTFYPLVPRRVAGEWQVEPAPDGGDTTNSDVALYDVELTFPAGLALAASGVEVERSEGEATITARFLSGPMRDFAFALGPLEETERVVDGVRVRAWALAAHRTSAVEMLKAAARQLELLNEMVGPYPYRELDIVDAPGAFGGIEYPGLVFVGTLGTPWLIEPTVHEVAHQWFYAVVGDDQLHEPWLDEALATYSEVLYYEEFGRPGAAVGLLSQFRAWLRSQPDPTLPIGRGVGGYPDPGTYAVFVYGKGALFLDALRGEIGDDAFGRFLADYYAAHRYGFATGEAFQAAAEASCACDLDSLFDLWVWEGGEVPGL